jgi:hypothetical protein
MQSYSSRVRTWPLSKCMPMQRYPGLAAPVVAGCAAARQAGDE